MLLRELMRRPYLALFKKFLEVAFTLKKYISLFELMINGRYLYFVKKCCIVLKILQSFNSVLSFFNTLCIKTWRGHEVKNILDLMKFQNTEHKRWTGNQFLSVSFFTKVQLLFYYFRPSWKIYRTAHYTHWLFQASYRNQNGAWK